MLLRSSSTPVLGSLLSSISESPNHHHHHHPPTTIPHSLNKRASFHRTGSQNFITTFSCNSSPISPSVAEFPSNGFRRAQSEGNLDGLANASSKIDEFSLSKPLAKFPPRRNSCLLETIPSFSFHNSTNRYEDEDIDEEEEDEKEETEETEELFNNAFRAEERLEATSELNREKMSIAYAKGFKDHMGFSEAMGSFSPQMYLARSLGITEIDLGFGFGSGSGRDSGHNGGGGGSGSSGDGNDNNLEEHYKRMVEENPGNPLFLRNYAQFLYQTKQDLQGAEEYYSRAILADPNDGEILSQYAKLVWELHRDRDRATSYFERAVLAATQDSHVHAAYASFLWEIEDYEDEDELNDMHVLPPLRRGAMPSATA